MFGIRTIALINGHKEIFLGINHSYKTKYNMVMVFFQFCNIENLVNFSKIFLVGKTTKYFSKKVLNMFRNSVIMSFCLIINDAVDID
jgi:hypothetical protein